MGNSQSYQEYSYNNDCNYFNVKYNLTPSLPDFGYKLIDLKLLRQLNHLSPGETITDQYIDLRNNFPNILNINDLPFNPIATVVYAIHYSLLKNKLPIFQPSMMYIYHNIKYYKSVKNLFSFDSIFTSIKKYGLCSETQYKTIYQNIDNSPSFQTKDRAESFKFIKIFKVDNDLELIKTLLKKKFPIIVGFTAYYDIENIESTMWIPDEKDNKLGGLSGLIVGYIDDRKMFIMAQSFGEYFGTNGFIMVPYEYILNNNYTFERYIVEFDSNKVETYINQKKKMNDMKIEKQYLQKKDNFESIFS